MIKPAAENPFIAVKLKKLNPEELRTLAGAIRAIVDFPNITKNVALEELPLADDISQIMRENLDPAISVLTDLRNIYTAEKKPSPLAKPEPSPVEQFKPVAARQKSAEVYPKNFEKDEMRVPTGEEVTVFSVWFSWINQEKLKKEIGYEPMDKGLLTRLENKAGLKPPPEDNSRKAYDEEIVQMKKNLLSIVRTAVQEGNVAKLLSITDDSEIKKLITYLSSGANSQEVLKKLEKLSHEMRLDK